GAAGDRDERRELRVAKAGECGRDARDDERDHDRRTGIRRRDGSRQHEDARPDDRADPERDEIQRTEGTLESASFAFRLGEHGTEVLPRKEIEAHGVRAMSGRKKRSAERWLVPSAPPSSESPEPAVKVRS